MHSFLHSCTTEVTRRFHAALWRQPARKSLALTASKSQTARKSLSCAAVSFHLRAARRRRAASARFTASAPAAAARHGRARGSRAVAAAAARCCRRSAAAGWRPSAAAAASTSGCSCARPSGSSGCDRSTSAPAARRAPRRSSPRCSSRRSCSSSCSSSSTTSAPATGAPSSTGTRRARRRSSLCRRRCRASASSEARCRRCRPPRCPKAQGRNPQRRCTGKSARGAATAAASCGRRRAATCSCCGAARSGSRPTPSCATGQRTTGLRPGCGRTRQDRRASRRRCAACASASGWPTAASPTAG